VKLEVKRGHRYFEFEVPTGEREDVVALIWRGTPEQADRIRHWLQRDDFKPSTAQKFPLTSFENFHGIQSVL
jgi:hypothetical protein